MKKTMKKALVLGSIFGIFSLGVANADTLTYTDSSSAVDSADWEETLSVSQFDEDTYGTLESVTITLSGTVGGDYGVENRQDSPAELDTTLAADLSVDFEGDEILDLVLEDEDTFDADGFDGTLDFDQSAGGSGYSTTLDPETGEVSITLTSDLAAFIGTGSLDFDVESEGETSLTGSSSVAFFADEASTAAITITYEYEPSTPTPAPEPATMFLLGTGLAGMGLVRRRRK